MVWFFQMKKCRFVYRLFLYFLSKYIMQGMCCEIFFLNILIMFRFRMKLRRASIVIQVIVGMRRVGFFSLYVCLLYFIKLFEVRVQIGAFFGFFRVFFFRIRVFFIFFRSVLIYGRNQRFFGRWVFQSIEFSYRLVLR